MIRIAGIALALVGGTVASGMGLSLMHGVLHEDPTPVRAQIIGHEPVVRRATAIQPTRLDAETISPAVESVQSASLAVDGVVVTPVVTDAAVTGLVDEDLQFPVESLRPQTRETTLPSAELKNQNAAVKRSNPIMPRRETVSRRASSPVATTIARADPARTESRALPPRVLIGVYR